MGWKSNRACVATGLWAATLLCAIILGLRYQYAPAATRTAAAKWPAVTALSLAEDRPTVVMFIHPRCPCTRASLNELEVLLTQFPKKFQAHVVCFQPPSADASWTNTDLWKQAAAYPEVALSV